MYTRHGMWGAAIIAGAIGQLALVGCEQRRGYDAAAADARRSEARSEEAAADARRDQQVADAKRDEANADARRDQAVADAKQAEAAANNRNAWTDQDNASYQAWERETHRDHRDFNQRSPDEQQAYRDWRAQHPG